YKMLGGQSHFLREAKLLGLLEHMNGGTVGRDLTPKESEEVGDERELAVGEIKSRLKQIYKRGNAHDYLISKGVFRLGLQVRCVHCSRRSWFPLENLRDTMTCPRCLQNF